jgi:hypothetical protein
VLGDDIPTTRPGRTGRVVIIAASVLLAFLALALAFVLGAAYFKVRRYGAHEGRLQRLVAQQPHFEQVGAGLEQEGSRLLLTTGDERELRAFLGAHGNQKLDEVLAQARRHAITRVFQATDMLYVLYFDARGTLRGFTCISA